MKKLLSIILTVCLIGVIATVPSVSAYSNQYADYLIFADGEFRSGGKIAPGCGTIVDENGMLVGGEGIYNGEQGSGSFEIEINNTDSDAIWKKYKYLRIVASPCHMGEIPATGAFHGGTVQFGKGNTYNFDQLEITGKTMGVLEKTDVFELDLSKVSKFDGNKLILSHMVRGYRVQSLELSNNDSYYTAGSRREVELEYGTGDDCFADDFSIFAKGKFQNNGKIVPECGTIIDDDGTLLGGEGINNGELGSGWFEIEIDDTGDDAEWKKYKYLRVVASNCRLGDPMGSSYFGGTVQFGAGNTYNFDQLEITGKTMNHLEKMDTYLIDLSKVPKFGGNRLLFSHMGRGYRVKELALTNHAFYDVPEFDSSKNAIYSTYSDDFSIAISSKDVYNKGEKIAIDVFVENQGGKYTRYNNVPVHGNTYKNSWCVTLSNEDEKLDGVSLNTVKWYSDEVKANENKRYTFTFASGSLEEGTYPLNLSYIYCREGEQNKIIDISLNIEVADKSAYDLYMSAVNLSSSVDAEGETSTISATIRNFSDYAISKSIEVDYYVDGKLFETVHRYLVLDKGKSVNVVTTKEYEANFGAHRITAVVRGADGKDNDTDNQDNIRKARFIIES